MFVKNAAQGKDLKLLTSAVLGVDGGRCHANSWTSKAFPTTSTPMIMCVAYHTQKNLSSIL